MKDFAIGFFRSTPYQGYEYELYYKIKSTKCCYLIKLNRGLTPLKISSTNIEDEHKGLVDYTGDIHKGKKVINFILPLTGDAKKKSAFKLFLSSFETVALNQDKFVTLTIIFGYSKSSQDGLNEKKYLENILNDFRQRTSFTNINLIYVEMAGSFSRAKLIQIGVESCCDNDQFDSTPLNENLMFFCDVDVLFNKNFLDLCRYNTARNKRVYFPILYSFYNPNMAKVLYNNESSRGANKLDDSDVDIEEAKVNLIINKESGYWRDSGFGMTCLYKDDFNRVGGFDDFVNKNGWGGEDLHLYRKLIKTNLEVVRSITPGLFHLYHPKECDKNKLDKAKYKDCISAKISNEASQKHFGLFYFNITDFS